MPALPGRGLRRRDRPGRPVSSAGRAGGGRGGPEPAEDLADHPGPRRHGGQRQPARRPLTLFIMIIIKHVGPAKTVEEA